MPTANLGDLELNYSDHGDGSPVLGIMGYSLDKRFWAAQIPAVTKTHRFIVFDNRGIGRSTGGAPTSIDQMADDSVRLLDHLGIEKAVMFGVSMGGAITQRLVLDHPDRVEALILAVTWARPIEFMRRQHELSREIFQLDDRLLLPAAMLKMFTPHFFEVGRELVDQMTAAAQSLGAERPRVDVLRGQLDAIDKHDVLAELGQVSCPTLVLGGHMDQIVPGFASEEIAAAIPGAALEMFATGHGCMIEEAEGFNAAVERFLGSLASARKRFS
ncbi:MAG: alpha/beta hydrolase [Actinomycetota bacterium]|nr:alpha/beta hydrolase [Actinomycetota bacterium]